MIRFFINQHKAINLLLLIVIGFGTLLFLYGRKEGFPNVALNVATIVTIYPGASADLVEELITDKIEEEIQGIDGRDRIISYSSEGRSVIRFEIQSNTTRLDTEIRTDIETAISRIDFPANIRQPIVEVLNFENTTINIVVGFVSKNKEVLSVEAIKSIAKRFRDDVRKIPGVGRVEFEDYPNLEVWVEVDPERLRRYDLELNSVVNAIRARNLNMSAGKVNLNGKEFFIKTTKEYTSLEDIENTIIRGNDSGQHVFLKDIASIRWEEEELTSYKRYKEMSGVWLNIYKSSKGDSITISKAVKELIATYEQTGLIPKETETIAIDDLATSINGSLNILSSNATIGLIFIFLCMIIFFNFRVTLLTVLGIPFSFCLGIIIMYTLGLTLNIVSMFGMIIVLGMVVDDAIIVAENVYAHAEKDLSAYKAALVGTREMVVPVLAVVSTTILAFLPLTTLPGILGDVLSTIPQTVIIMLFCSLLECIIVLPGHLAHTKHKTTRVHNKITDKTNPAVAKPKRQWFVYINNRYAIFLEKTLRKPVLVASIFIFILISASAIMLRTIPFVFFPGDAEYIVVNIETDKSNRLRQTEKIIDIAEREIRTVTPSNYVIDITSTVGADGTIDADEYKLLQPYIGSVRITLDTTIKKDDDAILNDVKAAISDIQGITKSSVSVIKGGPPVGKPIDIYIKGSQNADVVAASKEVLAFVNTLPNLTSITSSYEEGKEIVNINPSEALSSILNVNLNTAATTVSNAFAENTTTTITTLDEYSRNERNVDLIVKYAENEEKLVEDIYNTPVRNQLGLNIPIKSFSSIEFEKSSTLLSKENGEFYVSISAFLIDETSLEYDASTIAELITEKIPAWKEKFPLISFAFKGQQEEEQEQSTSLIRALFLAVFSIYFVLTVVFKSYLQPLIVMSIIPLGFVGVILGLFLTNTPIGLMSFLGGIALMGIIVNDSLVMVDKINRFRRTSHMSLIEATVEGARSRMRPILMTSLTTVVGITPLAYGFAGYDPFLGAMAISLMWGIILSTTLLLLLLPLFYVILDNLMNFIYRLLNKKYTIAEPHEQ
ncbi:hypothetical protein COTS27_00684 [Spirochaetota bacterium]|nr:hypothetical protein COTS27_00684 [Spirochaetota bacterium]